MISIGLPIYNGEKFLERKLDSLLSQTFSNFELIISDNNSTDLTNQICINYAKNDNRIKYFRQEKNLGVRSNYNFVLSKANYDFFVWTAVDDIMDKNFLEKSFEKLEKNKNLVCCMANIKFYGIKENKFNKINLFLKKFGLSFRKFNHFSLKGEYDLKIRLFLKKFPWHLFYGVYKTEILKKSPLLTISGFDALPIISSLRYGDIEILDNVYLEVYASGRQSEGLIQDAQRLYGNNPFKILFYYYPLIREIRKLIGNRLFLKNLDSLLRLLFDGLFLIFLDILMRIKDKTFDKGIQTRNLTNDA